MKYSFRFLGLIAAASIVFFSCEKETELDVAEEVPETTDPSTEEKTTPEENTEFDPSEYLMSFGASFENDTQTKVGINLGSGALTLVKGDKALAYNGTDSAVYVYDDEDSSFKAEGTPIALGLGVQVFYPAGDEFKVVGSDVIFTMPAAITGVDDLGAKNPLAGKIAGSAGNWSVTFKAVGSILQVGVTGDRELNTLTLSNTALDLGEGAEFTIGWDGENPTMTTTGDTKKEMTITGLSQALSGTAATYYFLLPAGIAYTDLTVTAGLDAPHNGGSNTFSIVRGNGNVARNKVMTMSFYAGLFSGGAGTELDPYKISCARDFRNISKYCAEGYTAGSLAASDFLAAHYVQTSDINFKNAELSSYTIGKATSNSNDNAFSGVYDGGDFTLSNFIITGTPASNGNEGVALFRRATGTIKNLNILGANVNGGQYTAGIVGVVAGPFKLQNCSISSSTITGDGNNGAGGLVGRMYNGAVTDCSATDMTFNNKSESDGNYYGGIVAASTHNATQISGCSLNGTTTLHNTGSEIRFFGGIIGYHQTTNESAVVTNCHNHSTISGGQNYIGGICGLADTGTFTDCTNDGSISGVNSVAGIVAKLNGGTVTGCVNTGNISATQNYCGGVVAYFTKGRIENSRSDATIIATQNQAGGLIGAIAESNGTRVQACFAKGNVKATNNVGGFIGQINADYAYIVNCLAAANVVTSSKNANNAIGGFVGYIKNATNASGKNAWIGNCAVYDVIVKAPAQSTTTGNRVRVGGFVGVHNKTTGNAYSKIQNCYYQGVSEHLGYGGSDDFTSNPSTNVGASNSNIGGFAGYSAATMIDCYSTPTVKAAGSGGVYTNNTILTQEFIYGNTNSNPAITTSTSVVIAANTTTLGGVLNVVDDTYSGMEFSDWDSYEVDGKYYYYPAALTSLGADFYQK